MLNIKYILSQHDSTFSSIKAAGLILLSWHLSHHGTRDCLRYKYCIYKLLLLELIRSKREVHSWNAYYKLRTFPIKTRFLCCQTNTFLVDWSVTLSSLFLFFQFLTLLGQKKSCINLQTKNQLPSNFKRGNSDNPPFLEVRSNVCLLLTQFMKDLRRSFMEHNENLKWNSSAKGPSKYYNNKWNNMKS